MRIAQMLFSAALLVATASTFALDNKAPCATYFKTCMSDHSVTSAPAGKPKMMAVQECVKKAATADTANGKACLDVQAKHGH